MPETASEGWLPAAVLYLLLIRSPSPLQARYGRPNFDFVPETFCLPGDAHLLKRAWDAAGTRGKWILKPVGTDRLGGGRVGYDVSGVWCRTRRRGALESGSSTSGRR